MIWFWLGKRRSGRVAVSLLTLAMAARDETFSSSGAEEESLPSEVHIVSCMCFTSALSLVRSPCAAASTADILRAGEGGRRGGRVR